MKSKEKQRRPGNPVAKHMEQFNRPSTHRDKRRELKRGRKPKHRENYDEK